jgi:RNase P subunit RPR2
MMPPTQSIGAPVSAPVSPRNCEGPLGSGPRRFHPDPSVCRVGDDFYLINSPFACLPDLVVVHSHDPVNWRQVGHVRGATIASAFPAQLFRQPSRITKTHSMSLRAGGRKRPPRRRRLQCRRAVVRRDRVALRRHWRCRFCSCCVFFSYSYVVISRSRLNPAGQHRSLICGQNGNLRRTCPAAIPNGPQRGEAEVTRLHRSETHFLERRIVLNVRE